jgi:hypothetical protein
VEEKGGERRHFVRHLYIKCIILPRQARDKHRENSKKEWLRFSYLAARSGVAPTNARATLDCFAAVHQRPLLQEIKDRVYTSRQVCVADDTTAPKTSVCPEHTCRVNNNNKRHTHS